jgi:hypothetical protein
MGGGRARRVLGEPPRLQFAISYLKIRSFS